MVLNADGTRLTFWRQTLEVPQYRYGEGELLSYLFNNLKAAVNRYDLEEDPLRGNQ